MKERSILETSAVSLDIKRLKGIKSYFKNFIKIGKKSKISSALFKKYSDPTIQLLCLFSSLLREGYLKAFVLVALNTGMRRGEILSLTGRDIDWKNWKNRIARLSKTKNGEAKIVRLNETAIEAFQSLPLRFG